MHNEEILATLTEKKLQLSKRISAIEADFKKGRSADFSEQTTESENDEVLDEIHHEAKVELQQVIEALHRLENDQYGICTGCAEMIDPKRLNVLPYTNICINCAS
ncbi:TraR/DksA family transcriptional regulator [Thalassotalea sp. PLHSN55]|uniref:TraR/DksA family transcriptional regulator n=1 Tax=Thalassotalea sp. PLHSN55 TaxID=3435888 RepID=UPI003F86C73F